MLAIENLVTHYGPVEALKGITLHVNQGEIVTLIGANGAGKSTTLRTISGLVRPTRGTITYEGHDLTALPPERIVALGLPVDARIGTVAARTSTPELTPGFQQSSVVVREVVEQIDATLRTVYEAVDALEDIDAVSQDVVIAVAQQLDKDRWFLFSHFAE